MTSVYHVPMTNVKPLAQIELTDAQRARMVRFGIRAARQNGTIVIARRCRCGTWQDYETGATVTERNTWEVNHYIERLEGDDWRCATCRMSHVVRDTASSGGNGGSGKGGKVTRRKPGNSRHTRSSYASQIAAAYGWTLLKVGNRYYMTKDGEQARSFSNLDQVLDFIQAYGKAA